MAVWIFHGLIGRWFNKCQARGTEQAFIDAGFISDEDQEASTSTD